MSFQNITQQKKKICVYVSIAWTIVSLSSFLSQHNVHVYKNSINIVSCHATFIKIAKAQRIANRQYTTQHTYQWVRRR